MALLIANPSKPRRHQRLLIASPPIDLTVTPPGGLAGQIACGEMCYLTAAKKTASLNTTGASNANAANFIGVSTDNYPAVYTDGVVGSPIPPGDPNLPVVQIHEDGDHLFLTTVGDTYNPYDVVYLGANGRTIQKTALGTAVGYVSPDQRQAMNLSSPIVPFPIAGAANVLIYIRIQPALVKGN